MKIIVLASQKGGAGKTTLCGHLSVQAALDGHKVALIDTDPVSYTHLDVYKRQAMEE